MLDFSTIDKVDSQKMCEVYDKWPQLAKNSFEDDLPEIQISDIDHIVFAGMGGSGTVGDVMSAILSKTNIHVSIVKGYLLPKTVDENTLVITTSVSGNTKETLTILEKSKTSKARFVAIASGGELKKYAINNKIEYLEIPEIHSPRASLVKFLYSSLNVFQNSLPIDKIDILESISMLEKTRKKINSSNLHNENPALSLAQWITNIPALYYPHGLEAATIRFKNSLQENAKMHVITEDIIETCHNGVVPWQNNNSAKPILVRGYDDYIKTKERWEILKEYFDKNDIEYYELFSVKGNILSKIINLIYQLDYASIYHALLNHIDPSPINAIDFIKSKL